MRKLDISRNCRLLHHQNLWCIPYLRDKFETHSRFLCLKRGPNTFTIAVTLVVYRLDRKCNTDNIQEHIRRYRGRPDIKCIHCAMITHLEEVVGYAHQRLLLQRLKRLAKHSKVQLEAYQKYFHAMCKTQNRDLPPSGPFRKYSHMTIKMCAPSCVCQY